MDALSDAKRPVVLFDLLERRTLYFGTTNFTEAANQLEARMRIARNERKAGLRFVMQRDSSSKTTCAHKRNARTDISDAQLEKICPKTYRSNPDHNQTAERIFPL
jgi:hypothetical protein